MAFSSFLSTRLSVTRVNVIASQRYNPTQIFLQDSSARRVIAFQIRTMGSSSLSHRCQRAEQTHDNKVSPAEEDDRGGGGTGKGLCGSDVQMLSVQPGLVISVRLQRKC